MMSTVLLLACTKHVFLIFWVSPYGLNERRCCVLEKCVSKGASDKRRHLNQQNNPKLLQIHLHCIANICLIRPKSIQNFCQRGAKKLQKTTRKTSQINPKLMPKRCQMPSKSFKIASGAPESDTIGKEASATRDSDASAGGPWESFRRVWEPRNPQIKKKHLK